MGVFKITKNLEGYTGQMADNDNPKDKSEETLTINAMIEFDSEWDNLRIMAVVCHQMFKSFIQAGFTEPEALRLTAFMVKGDSIG
jgi:hypothetical protein